MKKLFSILMFFFLYTNSLASDDLKNIKSYFQNKIDAVTTIIKTTKAVTEKEKDQRDQKVLDTLNDVFDFNLMARLSLGAAYKKIDKQKRMKFTDLYIERMKKSYSSKLDTYKNNEITVTSIKQVKSNRIELVTSIIDGVEQYDVSYKFYKPRKAIEDKYSWLIYDVNIEGISIIKTDKAQFKEYLNTHSIDELISSLEK
ncbi:MAG: ABC transporter substrate-binding protein [Campylobacterota bacterium]|nr:ABC transporter substrate-binding protein [Campylobacterota bacterium]